mgnify:CR=1 FL=1
MKAAKTPMVKLTHFEAFILVGGIIQILNRNASAQDPIPYATLEKLLRTKKKFESILEAAEKSQTTFAKLKEEVGEFELPTFKASEWQPLVRGEEALVFEKLTEKD